MHYSKYLLLRSMFLQRHFLLHFLPSRQIVALGKSLPRLVLVSQLDFDLLPESLKRWLHNFHL
jgi:hypothetical protein